MDNDKKTEQEKRLAEFKKQESRQKQLQILKRAGLWGGVILTLALMVWALAKFGSSSTPDSSSSTNALTEPVTANDHARGNQLAKVVLVEYSDFQCPACGQFYPIVKSVEEKYGKDFLLVYRYFPLPSHDKSDLASRVAEAAAQQGKFWEMHDKLFENQTTWSVAPEPEKLFTEYANQLGLDKNKFLADLKATTTETRIQKDISSGSASGVQGTPTFYLNGKMLNLQTYGDLESDVASAITENR